MNHEAGKFQMPGVTFLMICRNGQFEYRFDKYTLVAQFLIAEVHVKIHVRILKDPTGFSGC